MAASYKLLQDENKARGLAGQYQPSGNLAADAANVYLMATYFRICRKISAKRRSRFC